MPRLRGRAGDDVKAAQRREQALDLRIAGYRYRQIAERLGCSHQTAYRDVQSALAEQHEVNSAKADVLRRLEIERLDKAATCLEPIAAKGDPQAVNALTRISAERAKLLGLYAPTKAEVTGKDGEPLGLSGLTADELVARAQALAQAAKS